VIYDAGRKVLLGRVEPEVHNPQRSGGPLQDALPTAEERRPDETLQHGDADVCRRFGERRRSFCLGNLPIVTFAGVRMNNFIHRRGSQGAGPRTSKNAHNQAAYIQSLDGHVTYL